MITSVYVHAPFCARRCLYCDFAVEVRRAGDVDPWVGALAGELRLLGEEGRVTLAPELDTLYVGGGTPSLLGPTAMARLRDLLGPRRLAGDRLEWTAEANPESFTPTVAKAWRKAGLNRISLGVQSFSEAALRWMGRLHGASGAKEAVTVARDAGIDNVSVDLIFGLPAEVDRDWRGDLSAAVGLGVSHVSLYGLTAEPSTPLGRKVRAGGVRMPDDERYREEFLEASRFLTAEGFLHYEVSNFARPGYESRHNQAYWDGTPYLGLGNSSHSYIPPVRRWNLREWGAYLERVGKGRLPVQDEETVEGESERLERYWLLLRTSRGIPLDELSPPAVRARVERWRETGWAVVEGDRLVLTPEGWLLLDRLAVELTDIEPAARPA